MSNQNTQPNNLKGLFGIGTSILFVVLGVWLYTNTSEENATLYQVVGVLCIVFFGIIGILGIRKMLAPKR